MVAGIGIMLLAIVIDRITQAMGMAPRVMRGPVGIGGLGWWTRVRAITGKPRMRTSNRRGGHQDRAAGRGKDEEPTKWMVVADRWRRVMALLVAACSDVSSETSGGTTGSAAAGGARQQRHDHHHRPERVGRGEANVNVAKVLLEDKLGYTVDVTEIDEFEQFPASAGDIDATLEVWPSGHAKDYKQYIEASNGVVDGGQLGVAGQIGWWIPTYMLTDHPEFATWEG